MQSITVPCPTCVGVSNLALFEQIDAAGAPTTSSRVRVAATRPEHLLAGLWAQIRAAGQRVRPTSGGTAVGHVAPAGDARLGQRVIPAGLDAPPGPAV